MPFKLPGLTRLHSPFCLYQHCTCVDVQVVLDKTTTLFGRHQSGYIFPMLLSVKTLPNSFAGALQRLRTPDSFILFSTVSGRVFGACADSLLMMGDQQSVAVDDGDVVLSKFVTFAALQTMIKACETHSAGRTAQKPSKSQQVPQLFLLLLSLLLLLLLFSLLLLLLLLLLMMMMMVRNTNAGSSDVPSHALWCHPNGVAIR
jgi:hypothetical protein